MLKATVSGSFHRHMVPIYEAVGGLREAGVDVLSPSDPRVVDHIGDFLFVASDKLRSIKLVQNRHLAAIRASDFLWVVCPDGYTGASTSMEIGAAYASGIPVFSDSPALDITLGQYVTHVASLNDAVRSISDCDVRKPHTDHVLLDPLATIEASHSALDRLAPILTGRTGDGRIDPEQQLRRTARFLRHSFEACD